ncbi:MAG: hypothetical protein JW783_09145 [Bacteroidales bacterium]|nr:hypothetical protein [Bacteroidales bacterium]MBN2749731.1 hypothetical protein [Bacteroidales bacterium]
MSEKNYDPRMHTAEHILNQTMVRKFGCSRSFSAHIERKKSKCDYRIPVQPTAADIKAVEDAVNEVIKSGVGITESFVAKQEASAFVDLSKLPADAPEQIRIVHVGSYDACACIGPHVSNSGEIGGFKIISHDYSEGVLRLRFKLE